MSEPMFRQRMIEALQQLPEDATLSAGIAALFALRDEESGGSRPPRVVVRITAEPEGGSVEFDGVYTSGALGRQRGMVGPCPAPFELEVTEPEFQGAFRRLGGNAEMKVELMRFEGDAIAAHATSLRPLTLAVRSGPALSVAGTQPGR